MCIPFGKTHKGEQASLYTIKNEKLTAKLTDFGATLVQLWVPDKNGKLADVVLGYEEAMGYVLDLAIELPVYQRDVLYAYNSKVINSDTISSDVNPYSSPLDRIWELEYAN